MGISPGASALVKCVPQYTAQDDSSLPGFCCRGLLYVPGGDGGESNSPSMPTERTIKPKMKFNTVAERRY